MTVKRMDNVGIVVADLDGAIAFFAELGLTLEGRAPIEGTWADGVTGLTGQRVEIAMLRTPDGHSRLELSRFDSPPIAADHRTAPVNARGYVRVMFAVEDLNRHARPHLQARRHAGGPGGGLRKHLPPLRHPGAGGHPDRAGGATGSAGGAGGSDEAGALRARDPHRPRARISRVVPALQEVASHHDSETTRGFLESLPS